MHTQAADSSTVSDATPSPATVTLLGVELAALTEAGAVDHVAARAATGRGGWVVTVNIDILRRTVRDPAFAAYVGAADLVVADGMPLVWASRVQGTPLPERVAGSSMVLSLAERASEAGLRLFLLGGSPGAAEGAADALRERFAGVDVVGTLCPPMGFENDPQEMEAIRAALRATTPDIVYVALGSPKQEHLISVLRGEFPKVWWLGIGISLSFLAGQVQRAPRWVQRVGLEWLHRLVQEPRRLAKRYLVDGIPFACRLMFGALIHRWRSIRA